MIYCSKCGVLNSKKAGCKCGRYKPEKENEMSKVTEFVKKHKAKIIGASGFSKSFV